MQTPEMLAVLRGQQPRHEERHPDPRTARAAKAKAYQLLYKAAERHGLELTARVYIDPADPCVLVCDSTPRAAPASKYDPVLHLPVGKSVELVLGNTLLQSVKARLKELAAIVEHETGSRPCWVARPIPGQPGDYEVSRLPDGYNPATMLPRFNRDILQEQNAIEQRVRDFARMAELEAEWGRLDEASQAAGGPNVLMPPELAELERKYRISSVADHPDAEVRRMFEERAS